MAASAAWTCSWLWHFVSHFRGGMGKAVPSVSLWLPLFPYRDPTDSSEKEAPWPPYTVAEQQYVRLNTQPLTVDRSLRAQICAFWNRFLPKLLNVTGESHTWSQVRQNVLSRGGGPFQPRTGLACPISFGSTPTGSASAAFPGPGRGSPPPIPPPEQRVPKVHHFASATCGGGGGGKQPS